MADEKKPVVRSVHTDIPAVYAPLRENRYVAHRAETIREMANNFLNDPSPHDLMPEIAVARSILTIAIQDFEQARENWKMIMASVAEAGRAVNVSDLQPPDTSEIARQLAIICKIEEVVLKLSSMTSVSETTFLRVINQMGAALSNFVDSETKAAIMDAWKEIQI